MKTLNLKQSMLFNKMFLWHNKKKTQKILKYHNKQLKNKKFPNIHFDLNIHHLAKNYFESELSEKGKKYNCVF